MELDDLTASDNSEEGTSFGQGRIVRLERDGRELEKGSPLVAIILWLSFVSIIVFLDLVFLKIQLFVLWGVVLLFTFFYYIYYLNTDRGTGMVLDISEDEAVLSYLAKPPEEKARVKLQQGTVVDIVMDERVQSEEYGHLSGWSFDDGEAEITISASEGWELWDIQAIREPVYQLIERQGLERGEALRYYQQGLAGVLPKRRRTV